MTAGGVMLAGCNLQEGGNLPGVNRGKDGDGSVELGEVRAPGNSQELERLAEGYGTALAWILTIIGVLMVVVMLKLERRFVFYESED
jgi:hypothetical protein